APTGSGGTIGGSLPTGVLHWRHRLRCPDECPSHDRRAVAGCGRGQPVVMSVAELQGLTDGCLPGLVGLEITAAGRGSLSARLQVRPDLLAPNGFLHAATIVALADTACGFGCRSVLPEGAAGFTTIELKSNFLGTAREGMISTDATAVHAGRSTQVWDAVVRHDDSGRTIALFRCTQAVLWPAKTTTEEPQ
ncbi:MAG: PaaI family thioesterase, partial [Geodermatophilaceae bacterium]